MFVLDPEHAQRPRLRRYPHPRPRLFLADHHLLPDRPDQAVRGRLSTAATATCVSRRTSAATPLWPASPSSPTRTTSTAARACRSSTIDMARRRAQDLHPQLPPKPPEGLRAALRGGGRFAGAGLLQSSRRAALSPPSSRTKAMCRRSASC